jgi:hypothetical protein
MIESEESLLLLEDSFVLDWAKIGPGVEGFRHSLEMSKNQLD